MFFIQTQLWINHSASDQVMAWCLTAHGCHWASMSHFFCWINSRILDNHIPGPQKQHGRQHTQDSKSVEIKLFIQKKNDENLKIPVTSRWKTFNGLVSPLLTHWRYCSLALSHRFEGCNMQRVSYPHFNSIKLDNRSHRYWYIILTHCPLRDLNENL